MQFIVKEMRNGVLSGKEYPCETLKEACALIAKFYESGQISPDYSYEIEEGLKE